MIVIELMAQQLNGIPANGIGSYMMNGIGITDHSAKIAIGGYMENMLKMPKPIKTSYTYMTLYDTTQYTLDSDYHRCDGPALIRQTRWAWYLFGKRHRYYGRQHSNYPAWFIHDEQIAK